jgi:hypothetical protein
MEFEPLGFGRLRARVGLGGPFYYRVSGGLAVKEALYTLPRPRHVGLCDGEGPRAVRCFRDADGFRFERSFLVLLLY